MRSRLSGLCRSERFLCRSMIFADRRIPAMRAFGFHSASARRLAGGSDFRNGCGSFRAGWRAYRESLWTSGPDCVLWRGLRSGHRVPDWARECRDTIRCAKIPAGSSRKLVAESQCARKRAGPHQDSFVRFAELLLPFAASATDSFPPNKGSRGTLAATRQKWAGIS